MTWPCVIDQSDQRADNRLTRTGARVERAETAHHGQSIGRRDDGGLGGSTVHLPAALADTAGTAVAARTSGTALIAVNTLDDALVVLSAVRYRFPELDAAEYFHDDGLQLVLRHQQVTSPFGRPHPVYLLVELSGNGPVTGPEGFAVDQLADELAELPQVRDAVLAGSDADRRRLWHLRAGHAAAISAAGVPVTLDVALPLDRLARFEQELPAVVRDVAPGAVPILFGHLNEGIVHVNLLSVTEAGRDGTVADAVLGLAARLGGRISAENGIGLAERR
jgi:hypothetical protein